ncbi:hypothetical protein Tco_0411992 [Tanacetum coccineum]
MELQVGPLVMVVATLPFVTSSISATPEHESDVPADSITGLNLRTVGASARSAVVLPLMTEAVTTTHVATIPYVMALEYGTKTATPVYASMFHDYESTGTARPNRGFFSSSYNLDASREFIDHVAPPVLFAQIRDMDYDELFTEFNVGTVRQACLSAEVRMRTYKETWLLALENEKESLNGKVAELQSLVSIKDRELKDVDATVTFLKSQNDRLADQVRALEISSSGLQENVTVYENYMGQLERIQDDRMKVFNDKFNQLHTDCFLTQGMDFVVKCPNSPKYLSMLGAAISKAIEKGMQDGLSAGITSLVVISYSVNHEEVDINKKTENQAKMTKLSMEWKRLCKIKAKVQKCQSQSQYRRISSQTGAGTEEYYWMQS